MGSKRLLMIAAAAVLALSFYSPVLLAQTRRARPNKPTRPLVRKALQTS